MKPSKPSFLKPSKRVSAVKAACLALILCLGVAKLMPRSEDSIRSTAVQLTNEHGWCTGEQVNAPSGERYILTAAHCRGLEQGGQITAITEDGRRLPRRVLAEDDASDLLILEGIPGLNGLDIAKHESPRQHARSFTHGKAFALYKTEGALIQNAPVEFIIEKTAEQCVGSKYHMDKIDFFGILQIDICVMATMEVATTVPIVPGSSGGPIVDDSGKLIGVVSAGDSYGFGYIVRLQDIQHFLANY